MQIQPLLNEERLAHPGATHLWIIKHGDLTQTAAATAQTLTSVLAASMTARLIETQLKKPFRDSADAAHNSTLVTLGDSGSANRFMASTQFNANGAYVNQSVGTGTTQAYTAADTLNAAFTPPAGKNLAALDEGEIWFYVQLQDARFRNV